MRYIASISYGKDSLAMLEIIHQHDLPLTDIVTVDIMATPTIPAQLPDVIAFKARADRVIRQRYGLPVTHIRAPISFEEGFYTTLSERSRYPGTIYGWPLTKRNWCKRVLKTDVVNKFFGGL